MFYRHLAAKAQVTMGDEPAVDVLIDTLKNNDAKIKEITAGALGDLKNQRTVPALMCAENDNCGAVGKAA